MAECADSTPTKSIERVCVSPSSKEQICLLCAKVVSNNDFRRKLTSSGGRKKTKTCFNLESILEKEISQPSSLRNKRFQSIYCTGRPHNLFVSFYSKCTGFTVCFTYSDVSLTMLDYYVELPYLWCVVVLLPQKRFFLAILNEFEFAGDCSI